MNRSDAEKPAALDPAGPVSVEVIDSTRSLGPPALEWLRVQVGKAVASLGAAGEVRVRIVGDADMAAAHQRYKGVVGPTDVLTFDLSEGHGLDVDILVCADEAARQAKARAHPPEREFLLYIIHGILHCLGHDDHDPGAAARMHEAEDRLLESVGVGPVYARPAADAGKDTA